MRAITTAAIVIAMIVPSISHVLAGDGCCDHCGASCCVRRVCVPKVVEKEITKVCWDCKCEDICIPGPSKKCCTKCGKDECGCYSFDLWQPTCAKVKTRHVPVKKEVKRKVPKIEWTVEYRCDRCCQDCQKIPALPAAAPAVEPEGSPAPSPPPALK
ncbi:MAG: hypothetical protein KF708_18210 [Pirellulales bacterium]|nr:hypothetical protein [Pirellulales bacterium]